MIYSDSRYANGKIYRAYHPATQAYEATVNRTFPTKTAEYWVYQWQINDRIDKVAYRYFGNADEWWRILDFNPELPNPTSIEPGTMIRIPNDSRA